MLDAIMMYRLRFNRGLSIRANDEWITSELRQIARDYETLDNTIKDLDERVKNLAIEQGYKEPEYKNEI